jgi:HK97 family phage prohead protease
VTAPQASKAPPRDDVCRAVPFTLTRDGAADTLDGLTFEGYGAVFNSPTRIDSWEGTFDEQIAPGAFRKSIRERTPKFQFDHGQSNFGSLPPGVIEAVTEDDRGLFTKARMSPSSYWEPLRDAIATGAVDGMSIRFSVVRDEWRDAAGSLVKPEDLEEALRTGSRGILLRTIKEVKLAEVGPVVWPAYADTTASLRSKVIDLSKLLDGDPEQLRLFAETALRVRGTFSNAPDDGDESDEEPQDTPDGAVEHSGDDADTPQTTSREAGEHEPESTTEPAPTDAVDESLAAAEERLFTDALAEVRTARDSTPPMKEVN